MISDKKRVEYIVQLAQNEINNTNLPTVNFLITAFIAIIPLLVSSPIIGSAIDASKNFDPTKGLVAWVILLVPVITSMFFIMAFLFAFSKVIMRLSFKQDELSMLIQEGTRLSHKENLKVKEITGFMELARKVLKKHKLISGKSLEQFLDI
ncbi:Uncharacterised protein [uncultured archaeon]|nr:Uncharacterised protein [uncultured archaeon]